MTPKYFFQVPRPPKWGVGSHFRSSKLHQLSSTQRKPIKSVFHTFRKFPMFFPVTKRNEAKCSVVEGLAGRPKQSLSVPVTKRNEAKRSVV